MNADAAQRYASRATALRQVGLDGCRRSALASLRARTVVKESHATPVTAMAFNTLEPSASNLFASVGGDQATIYDDCHFGDFVGIVAQYTHSDAPGPPGSAPPPPPSPDAPASLTAIGWVAAPPAPGPHPHGDAWLAVGGADGALSVISVSEARVAFRMDGGGDRVVAVAGTGPGRPGLAAALHSGGALNLWCVAAEAPLAAWAVPGGTTVVTDPGATLLAVGDAAGRVILVELPERSGVEGVGVYEEEGGDAAPPPPPPPPPAPLPATTPVLASPDASTAPVEALAFLGRDGSRLLAKHADGRCVVWCGVGTAEAAVLAVWRVPGGGGGGGGPPVPSDAAGPSASALSVTADGALAAVGSPGGEAFVYDLASVLTARPSSGKAPLPALPSPPILARVKPPRIGGPIRAVALSDDGRHLSVAVGGGFVFRFEAAVFGGGGGAQAEEAAAGGNME